MAQSDEIIAKLATATDWALWECDEASGNLADSSGNGFTLVARGTPAYSQDGIEGTAIAFDGSADEGATAIIEPMGSPLGDDWTIGLWVKGAAQASKCLLSMTNGTTAGVVALLTGTSAGTNDDQLRMQVQTAGNSNVILTVVDGTVLDNTWHHIVVVGSGGNTVTPYIDGVAQTPLSGTWSSSRPAISNMAIACYVSNNSFPQNPILETAIAVDNVFCADIALAAQDVIDIYNAGLPDTTPPELLSAVVAADGMSVVLTFTEIGSLPLLPATGVTGFSLTHLGNAVSIDSVSRTDDDEITIVPDAAIPPGAVLLSYSSGNVTDTAENDLEAIVNFAVTNNSITETYAKITLLASVSSRMAPHTVFVTAAAESVPINGNWRYCSATWDFGDGTTVQVLNPVTNTIVNARVAQSSWAAASHIYETAGTYTITLTLTGSDGVVEQDTTQVTIVANTRTTKYLDSTADPAGDGSAETPWSTHAEMVADLVSNTTVIMSGTFDLDEADDLPAVSNVWFKTDGTTVTFNWTDNPVEDNWVFGIPSGAENILIDGKISTYTSRGIQVTSDVAKSTTKADNQTGFVESKGNSVTIRNCEVVGDIASGGIIQMAVTGGSSVTTPTGLAVLNCDFGDCNNYLSVFTQMSYVTWLGVTAGTAWIEHTQRWLDPTWSKYINEQWCSFDHKRIISGTTAATGAGAKDCIRLQAVKYATVLDSLLDAGAIDLSYHVGAAATGDYGPGHYIQISRCVIDDCGINLRPHLLDSLIANCVIIDTPVVTDIATPEAGSKVLDKVSILHNSFIDSDGSFAFLNFAVVTSTAHAFTKTNIELDGNLFATVAAQSGSFLRIDDSTLYTIFSSLGQNVFTDGLSVYVQTWSAAGQSVTASQDWATFNAAAADNDQETITAANLEAADEYRPDAATYTVIATYGVVRTEGALLKDLWGNARPDSGTWYVGAVDAESQAIPPTTGGNQGSIVAPVVGPVIRPITGSVTRRK